MNTLNPLKFCVCATIQCGHHVQALQRFFELKIKVNLNNNKNSLVDNNANIFIGWAVVLRGHKINIVH